MLFLFFFLLGLSPQEHLKRPFKTLACNLLWMTLQGELNANIP